MMMTVEDCRRKSAQWLDQAQSASDPTTIASMRRAAEAWNRLSEQIEEANLRRPHSPGQMSRPGDLAGVRTAYPRDTVEVGDVLRERLQLSGEAPDDEAR